MAGLRAPGRAPGRANGIGLVVALAALSAPSGPVAAAEADPVTVEAVVTPEGAEGPVRLGQPVILELTVRAPAGTQLFVHDNFDVGSFRLLGGAPPVERKLEGGQEVATHRLRLLPLRYGVEVIPSIEVPYRSASDGDGSVATGPIKVRVRGNLENSANPSLAGTPPPVDVIATDWVRIFAVSGLGAAILAALVTLVCLRVWRQRLYAAVPPPPPLPANEQALVRLAELDTSEADPDTHYAAVVDVLREYLGARYGFDGLETTTHEMRQLLGGADLKTITESEIHGFLDEADLIKFARMTTTSDEARERIPAVRRIVEATWEPPQIEAPDEVVKRLDPASGAERLKAGLVDVALGTALSGVAFGALWAAGLLEWSWLAVVLLGGFLLLRDVFSGRSPGKILLGLRVVSRAEVQETPPTGTLLTRNALLFVAPIGLPAELLVLAYHPLRVRVGDHLAGTEVVREGSR